MARPFNLEYYPAVVGIIKDGVVLASTGNEASLIQLAVAYNELRDALEKGELRYVGD